MHRFVWHVERCHWGVRIMMPQESFNFGTMEGITVTAFMQARQREMTWRYVKLLIFLLFTSKSVLTTKKSKFHFVQYWKQILPCESTDKGVSSRGSRVRTKFYGSIIDTGSERVLTMYNLTKFYLYWTLFILKKLAYLCVSAVTLMYLLKYHRWRITP